MEFPKPPLKTQREVGSGVEIRLNFLTEDVHMSPLGNVCHTYFEVLSEVYKAALCLDFHYFRKCFFPKYTQLISDLDFVNNSPEGFEMTLA